MQLNVSGHHVEVTESLREYVETKIEKIERHFDIVSDVHCILTVEKLRHKAEATVNVNGGTIYADAIEEDMYAAIDSLIDKLSMAQARLFPAIDIPASGTRKEAHLYTEDQTRGLATLRRVLSSYHQRQATEAMFKLLEKYPDNIQFLQSMSAS